jgi:hypothetical protein
MALGYGLGFYLETRDRGISRPANGVYDGVPGGGLSYQHEHLFQQRKKKDTTSFPGNNDS